MLILAVDDRKDNLLTMEAVLGDILPDASILTARSGTEGLQEAVEKKPDVILLDLGMPGMDGYEVSRRLRENPETRSIPIIAVTALDTSVGNKVRALDAGADAFLVKPIDETELLAQLRVMLRIREAEATLQKEKSVLEDKVRERTSELEESYRAIEQTLEETVYVLAKTVESRDPYTSGHQKRVAELGLAMARKMGFSDFGQKSVYMSGLIHDIGKIQIPSEILSKPGKINDAELAIIREHPTTGHGILKTIQFPWPVADIVKQHHERMNGSGYPLGLKGDDMLLESRIIAVADVVEAMSSHRPYRAALGLEEALAEVSNRSGDLYDPDAVQSCLELFEKDRFVFPEVNPL
ncbi:MAG: response regulator [Synergistota bacterium]|nr:response regulator [Synergistota bacterium]